MRSRLPGIPLPATGVGVMCVMQPARALVGPTGDLGPFVVRRFVDFALTESMMCRRSS